MCGSVSIQSLSVLVGLGPRQGHAMHVVELYELLCCDTDHGRWTGNLISVIGTITAHCMLTCTTAFVPCIM